MKEERPIGAVLVYGGGIAGIQASLDLADSGFKVYLVERSSAVGGRMPQLDKTFPTGDCSMCILSPKLVECGRNKNIDIITLGEIEGISGEPGHFDVAVKTKPSLCRPGEVQRLRRLRRGLPGQPAQRLRPRPRRAEGDLPRVPAGRPQRLHHRQGRRHRPLQAGLSGGRERAGVRRAHRTAALQGGLRGHPRALPAAGGLRPHLPAPLRGGVQPRRRRRARRDPRPEALRDRLGLRASRRDRRGRAGQLRGAARGARRRHRRRAGGPDRGPRPQPHGLSRDDLRVAAVPGRHAARAACPPTACRATCSTSKSAVF